MLLLSALLLLCLSAFPQSWHELMDEVMTSDDAADDASPTLAEESYELLEQLEQHPLDLNRASREELEQLPFLSAQQVMDIEEYLYRHGPMRSLGELRMVRSLDYRQIELLPFFVFVSDTADVPPADTFPRLDTLLHRAKHTVSFTTRLPMQSRSGDHGRYYGYPYRHTLRYEMSSSKRLRIGIVGAQDSGEPFMAAGNNWGYDCYSYYLQLQRVTPWLNNVVAGKYKLSAGMGLVLGQSFQLGKLATQQNLGRQPTTIRPHSSRSEADYFQGVAATVTLARLGRDALGLPRGSLVLSPFVSRRSIDATLTDEGAAQTLLTSGYHRTPTEMGKKGNTHITSGGSHLQLSYAPFRLGLTAVASCLDRELQPLHSQPFRRYYPRGRHFFNMSADYSWCNYSVALSGETATDGHGHLATINCVSYQPSAGLSLMALQRFYSYRYTSLYGHAFADGSRTQNESGIYLGVSWNPIGRLQLQAYADYAYHPWMQYLVSASSESCDALVQATWQHGSWTLSARHRSRLRQKDNDGKTALIANDRHEERLTATYASGPWTLRAQAHWVSTRYKEKSNGWMVSEQAMLNATVLNTPVRIALLAAYFDTDSYQSRVYTYESQLRHEFYFPSYYGQGMRLAVLAQAKIGNSLTIGLRGAHTKFFDRSTIGTGLQQIAHSHQGDVDVQVTWRIR